MKKHPVVCFYVLAFAISWLGWAPAVAASHGVALLGHPIFQLLLILPAVGPILAAVIVTRVVEGKAGVGSLFKPFGRWRVGAFWWAVATLGPALLLAWGKAATWAFALTPTATQAPARLATVLAFALMSLLANPWEEVGWRGFALTRLQRQHTAFSATLVVGVCWGLWHLPLFFWVGHPMSEYPFATWLLGTVALSLVYTWLYNSTAGSLLIVTLFHVMGNVFGILIPGISESALALVYGVVAILLLVVYGPEDLARRERGRAA